MIPSENFVLSPEAETFRTDWIAQWNELEARRQALENEGLRIDGIPPEKFDAAAISAKKKWRLESIDVGQKLIAHLSTYVTVWPEMIRAERVRHETETQAKRNAAAKKVAAGLRKIGYDDADADTPYVATHKTVSPLDEQLYEVRSKLSEGVNRQEIEARIKRIKTQLEIHLRNAA